MTYNYPKTVKLGIMMSALALITTVTGCTTTSYSPTQEKVNSKAAATKASSLEVLASYPAGSFLENLEVQQDGRVLFTNYFAKTIEQVTPNGEKSVFASLSAFPVSIISSPDGYLVTAQSKNFMLGDPVNPQQFLLLDRDGNEVGKFAPSGPIFMNGMVELENGDILIADSVASTIWKLDLSDQTVTPWLQDAALAPDPAQASIPGANGLKLHSRGLVVSNTAQGSLFLIAMDDTGAPSAKPTLLAKTGIIDDFWVNPDDSIIFTTHTDVLKSLATDGTVSDVISAGCNGCTAIAPFPIGQTSTYIFINDGGFFFGEKNESTVSVVTVE